MTYPGLFSRYQPLKGKGRGWIKTVAPEDRAVFVDIGLQEAEHGSKGGKALVKARGKDHMKSIGRIGAIVTNSWKWWNKALNEELSKELGIEIDF